MIEAFISFGAGLVVGFCVGIAAFIGAALWAYGKCARGI